MTQNNLSGVITYTLDTQLQVPFNRTESRSTNIQELRGIFYSVEEFESVTEKINRRIEISTYIS